MTATIVDAPADLLTMVGTEIGPGEWVAVEQDRVDGFADATDDHQWIHIDPERAADGPFGTTIAHGFLTLALLVPLVSEVLVVDGASTSVNYGLDRVRFTAPVPVGSRVRVRVEVAEASEVRGGVQVALDCTIEVEGQERPAVVARWLARHLD